MAERKRNRRRREASTLLPDTTYPAPLPLSRQAAPELLDRLREFDATAGALHDTMAQRGAKLMVIAISALERGSLQFTPQPEAGVVYATKIEKSETRVDWKQPWQKVHDHCRGLSPFPGAWFELADVGRVKVLRTTKGGGGGRPGQVLDDQLTIACGDGAVRLVELQRAGRQPMSAEVFLRGTPVARGNALG